MTPQQLRRVRRKNRKRMLRFMAVFHSKTDWIGGGIITDYGIHIGNPSVMVKVTVAR